MRTRQDITPYRVNVYVVGEPICRQPSLQLGNDRVEERRVFRPSHEINPIPILISHHEQVELQRRLVFHSRIRGAGLVLVQVYGVYPQ